VKRPKTGTAIFGGHGGFLSIVDSRPTILPRRRPRL
jgi:hypothetical protein